MADTSIQVICRLRPMNKREAANNNALPVVTASTEKKEVTVVRGSGQRTSRSTFNFARVFGSFSTQEEVFDQSMRPVINDVLGGFESTVFAYGQTGTGKTHTMEGDISTEEDMGIIPRTCNAIFERLEREDYIEHKVEASYLEIYNEELSDLLGGDATKKLQIMEERDTKGKRGRGLFCQNLTELEVNSAPSVLDIMKAAQDRRRVGETKMNKQSSRSHCIFMLKVYAKRNLPDGTVLETTGKIHLVDLAGSECAKSADKGGAVQESKDQARERRNINSSLLTLGRVISALRQRDGGDSNTRIPYRDSKLTRLLQEALGGRCKTVIIATLSPSVLSVDETLSTLNYAQAAHGIQNKPIASSLLKTGEGYTGDGANSTSCQGWHEMEVKMQYLATQLEEAQAALARKHTLQAEATARAEVAEEERDRHAEELVSAAEELEQQKEQVVIVENELKETTTTLALKQHVLGARSQELVSMQEQAEMVLGSLKGSINEADHMQSQLEQRCAEEERMRSGTKQFAQQSEEHTTAVVAHVATFAAQLDEARQSMVSMVQSVQGSVADSNLQLHGGCDALVKQVRNAVSDLSKTSAEAESDEASHRLQEASAMTAIEAAIRAGVMESVSKVGRSMDQLCKHVQEHDAKLNSMSQQLTSSTESSQTEMEGLAAVQRERVQESNRVATQATEQMKMSCESHHSYIEQLQQLMQVQISNQLDQLQSSLVQLDQHAADSGAAQLQELQSQQTELATAAAAHKAGARHQDTLKGVSGLSEAARAAEQQQKSMLSAIEATLQNLSQSQTAESKAAEQSAIEQLNSLKQLVHDELDAQKQLVDEQITGLQQSYECGVEGNREEELTRKLTVANENSERIEREQNALIQQQADELEECKKQLRDMSSQQEDGRKHLAAELMAGIGAMVEQQVAGLAQKFTSQYDELDATSLNLEERNEQVRESVAQMGQLRVSDTAAVASEAAEWGEANREIGVMTQQAQQEGRDLKDVMDEHSEKVSTKVGELCVHNSTWAKSNAEVAAKTLSESVAVSETQQVVSEAAAVTQEYVAELEQQVESWARNDAECQQVLGEVDAQHNELATKITEDLAHSRAAVAELTQGTAAADGLNSDGIGRVGDLLSENTESMDRLSQFETDLSAARELELLQDQALCSATVSLHEQTLKAVHQMQSAAPVAPHVVPELQSSRESLQAMEASTQASLAAHNELVSKSHTQRSAAWSKMMTDRTAAHTCLVEQVVDSSESNQAVVQQGTEIVEQECLALHGLYNAQHTETGKFHASNTQQVDQLSTKIGKFCAEVVFMDEPVAELQTRPQIECPQAISQIRPEHEIESEFGTDMVEVVEQEEQDHDILFNAPAVVPVSPQPTSPQVPAHRRSPQSMLVQSVIPEPVHEAKSSARTARSKLQGASGLQAPKGLQAPMVRRGSKSMISA